MSIFINNDYHTKKRQTGYPLCHVELFFHGINGNILFCCTINELHEAMSFSLAQEIEPIRNITVRLEHAVHIRKLHQDPIPFHRPTPANAVSIEFQLVFRLTEKTFDRPTLGIVAQDVFIA